MGTILQVQKQSKSYYSACLCIYGTDSEKMIQECQNPIAEGNGILAS
ncbi:MAG: hypothetical protein K2M46_07020 [Lachnospiraceae bacterium]|nr:hypothetical protein [Lachnospiraceae bacterium]